MHKMAADGAGNPNDEDIFIYTTGSIVPRDVVRCRVHPSVTTLPADVFFTCRELKEVELCEGLLEIEERAFFCCSALKQIAIPSTVIRIGGNAFYSCTILEDVELCEGLQEIGKYAFIECKSLKHMTIPSTVAVINSSVFEQNWRR